MAKSPYCASHSTSEFGLGGGVTVLEAITLLDSTESITCTRGCESAMCCSESTWHRCSDRAAPRADGEVPAAVLPGEAHCRPILDQRRVGERLGASPVERLPRLQHLPAVFDQAARSWRG